MSHEAIFPATCNATVTTEKHCEFQSRGKNASCNMSFSSREGWAKNLLCIPVSSQRCHDFPWYRSDYWKKDAIFLLIRFSSLHYNAAVAGNVKFTKLYSNVQMWGQNWNRSTLNNRVQTFIGFHALVSNLRIVYMYVLFVLQIVNYGIAGHYEPHYDFARVRNISTASLTFIKISECWRSATNIIGVTNGTECL